MSFGLRIFTLLLYLIGMGIVTTATVADNVDIKLLMAGYLILIPSWVICLWSAIKVDQIRDFWFLFLLLMSGIAIPIFLLTVARKKSIEEHSE